MTTALVKQNTTAVATSAEDPFDAYAKAGGGEIEGTLLKFVKGDYLAGRENREIPTGTRLIANMEKLKTGYVRWDNGKPVDHRMGLVAEGFVPPWRRDLGDNDKNMWAVNDAGIPQDPWQKTEHLVLADPQTGAIYTLVISSGGGRDATRDLCTDYAHGRRQHPDSHPVIELGVDSYQHPNKQVGRVKVPTFRIVGWCRKDLTELQPSQAANHLTAETPPQRRVAPPREEAPPWLEHPDDPGRDFNDDIPW
jgi:hypothetical protein